MTVSDAGVERAVRLLRADIAATLGADFRFDFDQYLESSWSSADDDESFLDWLVNDVQQFFHDNFIDTTWPACPRHPNHPLWLQAEEWWCCGDDRIARLGELAAALPPDSTRSGG
jgi:hypothetical protein